MDELPRLPPGLVAVTGDEGTGKTSLLRRMAAGWPDVAWEDLALPGVDDITPVQLWEAWRSRWSGWDAALMAELVEALDLTQHRHKQIFMLSRGSRRKVAIAGLLASGARVVCLDQPFAAVDAASSRVLVGFLEDMAGHPTRTWVVADYEADARLPWARIIELP